MALPTQAIEKLSESPAKTPGAYSQLLFLGSALFVLSLALYFGLSFGYLPYLEKQADDLRGQIAAFARQVPQDRQDRAIRFYSELANIQKLLAAHVASTPFFAWLEDATLPGISISKAAVNTVSGQVLITANGRSLADSVAQVKAFEARPSVLRVLLGGINRMPDGLWQANLTLYLAPEVFKYSP